MHSECERVSMSGGTNNWCPEVRIPYLLPEKCVEILGWSNGVERSMESIQGK